MLDVVLAAFFSPVILFFVLGMISVFVKSDVTVPPAMSTAMVIFLMVAIGLTGGVGAIEALKIEPALFWVVGTTALFAVICGPFFAFSTAKVLKGFVKLKTADAWACGGAYGAVSSVTLAVAVGMAVSAQAAAPHELIFVGWMPAMYPFMDSPALVTAILFGRMAIMKEGLGDAKADVKKILHLTVFGAGVWLLVTSLFIGMLAQLFAPAEMQRVMVFFDGLFRGVLCLFLFDMGMAAARRIGELKALGRNIFKAVLVAFAIPQVWASIGILGMYAINLAFPGLIGWGDAFVFASIAGGCSYVTAPAAMRASMPEANPSVYLPMAIAITFPFNILVAMPFLWRTACMALWGA